MAWKTTSEMLQNRVEQVLEEIDEKPLVRDCVRFELKKSDCKHPLPVEPSISNADHVAQILRNSRKLHTKEEHAYINIRPVGTGWCNGNILASHAADRGSISG